MGAGKLSLLGTLTGAVGFSSSLPQSRPVEALVALRSVLGHWGFDLGVGAGLNDGAGNPRWRIVAGVMFLADPIQVAVSPPVSLQ